MCLLADFGIVETYITIDTAICLLEDLGFLFFVCLFLFLVDVCGGRVG